MPRRRLLIITSVPSTATAFLLPYARHFRQQGYVVDLLSRHATQCTKCVAAFDHVFDVNWSRRPMDFYNLRQAPGVVRSTVRAGRYDIVHVHDPIASFVSRLALRNERANGRPVVVYTAHGFHFHARGGRLSNLVFGALERVAGRWTDRLIVINRADHAAALLQKIVPERRLHYMPGIGVDTQAYDARNVESSLVAAFRREIGVDDATPLIAMIAEFNPGKRHADAVLALARSAARDAHLVFAGIGPLMADVQALAERSGVGDRVHLLGYRSDIPTLLRSAVATILPSEREGLPRCIMESLCMERPVIGTRIRGVTELVDEDTGVLVDVGDIDGLARAIDALVSDTSRAGEMGRIGRRRMKAFDLERVLELHDALYDEILG